MLGRACQQSSREDTPTPSDYKLPPPTRQDMVDWVEKAFQIISDDMMI